MKKGMFLIAGIEFVIIALVLIVSNYGFSQFVGLDSIRTFTLLYIPTLIASLMVYNLFRKRIHVNLEAVLLSMGSGIPIGLGFVVVFMTLLQYTIGV
jgi:flagellar biosynthesis protein FliQ